MARISLKALSSLCQRMGVAMEAGVGARESWQREARRLTGAHGAALDGVSERINAGDTWADAMAAQGKYFPATMREMVSLGEQTGKLDESLLKLAEHYDHLIKLRRTLLQMVAWPLIQLVAGVLVVGLLIWVLNSLGGADLLGLGLSANLSLLVYLLGIAVLAAAIVTPVWLTLNGTFGPWPLEIAYRIPVLGGQLRTMSLARMAWALSLANGAGMDARESVQLALRNSGSPYFTRHAESIDAALLKRGEINEVLRATGAFPIDFLDSVESGELTGNLAENMERLATDYRAQAQMAGGLLALLIGFFVWGAVGVLLIFIIVRLFITLYLGPIYEAMEPI